MLRLVLPLSLAEPPQQDALPRLGLVLRHLPAEATTRLSSEKNDEKNEKKFRRILDGLATAGGGARYRLVTIHPLEWVCLGAMLATPRALTWATVGAAVAHPPLLPPLSECCPHSDDDDSEDDAEQP